ncbi:MAG: HEAT repeat domain-containing protein, partial [Ignavibacteria bacterium]|nr:HEAT repeat domain-containing protein [Ignavibacteria bacterium]
MKRLIFLSILLPFMVTGSLFAADPALTREIQQAQDQRDGVMLARFFSNPDAEVRRKAIIAAGSVQDTSHIALLVSSLRDPVPGVRAASAFALGQMTQVVSAPQRRLISAGLLASIRDGEDASVVDAAVQGLGKCGDAAGLQDLIPAGQALEDGTLQQSIALAVGRYAYRGIRKMTATAFAAKLLEADTGVPWQAAYAMMRIGADSLLRPFVPPMIRGLQDRSADARMYLAAAIGSAGDDRAVPRLIELATADPDWRVRVNAV